MARLVLTFMALSVLMVGIVGTVSYLRARDALKASVFDRLDTAAEQKADSLDRWIDEQRRSVVFAGGLLGGYKSGSVELGRHLRAVLAGRGGAAGRTAHERVATVLRYSVVQTADAQELLVLGLDGRVAASTVPAHESVPQAGEAYFRGGSSKTAVQPVGASGLTGEPTITISTPLFDPDGARIGVIAANLNLERIDRIVLSTAPLSAARPLTIVSISCHSEDVSGRPAR